MSNKRRHYDTVRSASPYLYNDSNMNTCDIIQRNYTRQRAVRAVGSPFDEFSMDRVHERRRSPIIFPSGRGTIERNFNRPERQVSRIMNDENTTPVTRHHKRRRHQKKAENETELFELVSEIVKRLIKLKGTCKVSIKKLKHSVYSDMLGSDIEGMSKDGTFEGFLREYKDVFSFGEDRTVTYNFRLQICKTNGTTPGSCFNVCTDLHLCKFHIMSDCISSGCRYGHGEDSEHNNQVLRHHFLDKLTKQEVGDQLLELCNRRGLTVPEICTFYNAKGCSKKQTCTFLHVCKFYVSDCCEFTSRCKRCHNLSDPHAQSILRSYGLQNTSDVQIKQLLKNAISEQNDGRILSRSPPNDSAPCHQWIIRIDRQRDRTLDGLERRRLEQMYKDCLDVVKRYKIIREDSFQDNFAQTTVYLKGSDHDVEIMRMPVNTFSQP